MPIHSQWLILDFITVEKEQDAPGVYELGDSFGNVVYIGGSLSLRSKLLDHLKEPISSCIRSNANSYRTEYNVDPAVRLKQLQDEHLALHRIPPICNELNTQSNRSDLREAAGVKKKVEKHARSPWIEVSVLDRLVASGSYSPASNKDYKAYCLAA